MSVKLNSSPAPTLSNVLTTGLNSKDQALRTQATQVKADLSALASNPQDQGLQSRVQTDFQALGQAEGLESDVVNDLGAAASKLTGDAIDSLLGIGPNVGEGSGQTIGLQDSLDSLGDGAQGASVPLQNMVIKP